MTIYISNKKNEKKTKTIPGISKWFEWNWPVTGQFAGYIRARPLPHIGTWTEFSPAQVASFCGASYRPSPTISDPTIPKSSWVMPIPDEKKGSIRIIVLIKDNYNREKNVKCKILYYLIKNYCIYNPQSIIKRETVKRFDKK